MFVLFPSRISDLSCRARGKVLRRVQHNNKPHRHFLEGSALDSANEKTRRGIRHGQAPNEVACTHRGLQEPKRNNNDSSCSAVQQTGDPRTQHRTEENEASEGEEEYEIAWTICVPRLLNLPDHRVATGEE